VLGVAAMVSTWQGTTLIVALITLTSVAASTSPAALSCGTFFETVACREDCGTCGEYFHRTTTNAHAATSFSVLDLLEHDFDLPCTAKTDTVKLVERRQRLLCTGVGIWHFSADVHVPVSKRDQIWRWRWQLCVREPLGRRRLWVAIIACTQFNDAVCSQGDTRSLVSQM
jgi:hypothetical protein